MRGILIANDADNDAGVVGAIFVDLGYTFTQLTRENAENWPKLGADIELVVSLGSEWSVYWPDIAKNMECEADLLREAHQRRIPTLGICFGAQMLAHALGGSVLAAPTPEIGWFTVVWKDNFEGSEPLFAHLGADFGEKLWFQWHYDTFLPPSEAQILATSPVGIQAFRLGTSLGIQFHPEVTPAIVERWMSGKGADEIRAVGREPDQLRHECEVNCEESRVAAVGLVAWFFSQTHK